MTPETLRKLCAALSNSETLAGQKTLEVLWHAGEPLTVGIPFYREAAEIFAGRLLSRCRIRQTFQTNGTLITDSWCEYFIESKSAVGVSLDGPKEIHDAQRSGRDGRASFEQVMRGISALRDHNIPLNGLCVLPP